MVHIPWRTGVNMREFAYYGTAARQHTNITLQQRQADQLQAMQVKLVRFYASFNQFATEQCIEKVRAALDLLHAHEIQAVVCFADSLGSEFTIGGEGEFHSGPLGHLVKRYWHEQAYQRAFLPFVTSLVRACVAHPAVFIWELGNEYAIHPQPASWDDGHAFLDFARTVSQAIKGIAPNTLVSTGLVGSHHVAPQGYVEQYGRELYGLSSIDAVSIHYYADDGEKMSVLREMALARGLGKPFYIGEFGAPAAWPDRGVYYRAQLDEWYRAGAFTAMPWAFDVSASDVGVSDDKAFARIRPAFDEIQGAVREFSRPVEPLIVPAFTAIQPISTAKTFVVTDGPVYSRTAPSLAPGTKIDGWWLVNGQAVDVEAGSRTVADNYIWWKHRDGWSAECSVDRTIVLMIEVSPAGPARREMAVAVPLAPYAPIQTRTFRVLNGPVNWRNAPTLEPRALIRGKSWRTGQSFEVDAHSRTEAEGYVWWRHREGWCAERSLTTFEVLLIEDTQIVSGDTALFERLPLDLKLIQWIQYFGNTTFAYAHGAAHNYDSYSQGLHGGLDLGRDVDAPVCAAVRADLGPVCTYVGSARKFEPNRVDVTVGQYLIIFGHLVDPDFSLVGKPVTPDTVLGYLDTAGERHTHIEIRRGGKLLNPLQFLPVPLREAFLKRFPPSGDFQPHNGQWEGPLNQPDIELGGRVIGPRAAG